MDEPDRERVGEAYRHWSHKGPVVDGRRLTVLSATPRATVGEPVLVYHVVEVTAPGRTLWIAGPKAIVGEYVDGELATPSPASDEDPLEPLFYDGPTQASPGLDLGWAVTRYAFDKPGPHEIQWRIGDLASNVLIIDVALRAYTDTAHELR